MSKTQNGAPGLERAAIFSGEDQEINARHQANERLHRLFLVAVFL